MPRKPRRHRPLTPRPTTFSRFSRSVALAAACSLNSKVVKSSSLNNPPSKLDNGPAKDTLRRGKRESDSSDDEAPQEAVQADFAFFDPKPGDFHGVKILLQTYLDDKQWDLSGFVDLILSQTTVGTVVKIEDDEDDALFALLTVLNLGRYKGQKCIVELKGYLLKACEGSTLLGELEGLLEDKAEHVGLVVSPRVMNLPPQLLPHLYNALFDEIIWATEDEPTEDLRKSFRFRYYLLVTKIYKKNSHMKKGSATSNDEDVIYLKPEDELFHKLSSWSITFPLRTQHLAAQELRNHRLTGLVMAVQADKSSAFQNQLRSLIDES
uniref:Protein BCCIP homolog n=1 Tax=Opuntia streptacantha TaxID=393608 RepID=A0A7C9DUQ7_OPUST